MNFFQNEFFRNFFFCNFFQNFWIINHSAQKQSVADEEIFTIRKADRKRAETETQIEKLRIELKKVEDEKEREYEKAAMQINELKKEIEQVSTFET